MVNYRAWGSCCRFTSDGYDARYLDDVAVGIEDEELREPGGSVAADHDTHRVVLRRVFAKTVDSQRGERTLEIIGAESEMGISAVDVAGPERPGG